SRPTLLASLATVADPRIRMTLGSGLVGLSVLGALLSVASVPARAGEDPDCVRRARALAEKALELSAKGRARMIELAVRSDVSIVCGVVSQSFFASQPEAPKGCDARQPIGCADLRVVPLS